MSSRSHNALAGQDVRGTMKENALKTSVRTIMLEFSEQTGLTSDRQEPRRYLWTDAFAVCNFLGLYRQTGDIQYKRLALHLVGQVHSALGRHRNDDSRTGWISGLDEHEGRVHPTQGGLRIGKGLNERMADDPYDERLEWDRDGQYYHYLTKWMHALYRTSRVTGDPAFNRWAIELAKTAHARFTYRPSTGGQKRMYWKMSIDLSRPLVSSMGHHDPLDGFITYLQLRTAAAEDLDRSGGSDLGAEITDMAGILEGKDWDTDDPLGIGELLCSAYKLAQLIMNEGVEQGDLLDALLNSSVAGLQSYAGGDPLGLPAEYRLAFRELGLSIGLHAVEKLQGLIEQAPRELDRKGRLSSRIESLLQYIPLSGLIEKHWLDPANRKAGAWMEHLDINRVMLATSLFPDGYLLLR